MNSLAMLAVVASQGDGSETITGGVAGFSAAQLGAVGLAIAILTLVMISTHRRSQASRRNKPTGRTRAPLHAPQTTQARRDLESVMLELDQLSRQVHGRIDT